VTHRACVCAPTRGLAGLVQLTGLASGTERIPTSRSFCDSWEQASHGGELAAAVTADALTREGVTELGQVLTENGEGRRSAADITLFDSTGLAIQDLAIAIAAYSANTNGRLPTLEV
jgi:alanine dehydrogenase